MVHDLDDPTKKLLKEYVADRCPGSAEVVDALFWVADTYPKQLRTKELCETIEAVTLIGAVINPLLAEDPSRKTSMTIYDLACGHGLGGTLLAYRFPDVKVVCIDLERRPCWTSYREVSESYNDMNITNYCVCTRSANDKFSGIRKIWRKSKWK